MAAYKFFSHRPAIIESDEPEDMWASVWDDLKIWLMTSPIVLVLGSVLFGYGASLVSDLTPSSTYFCSSQADQSSLILCLQIFGLVIDAVVVTLLWRVLSWARTTRNRLRTFGSILLFAALAVSIFGLGARLYQHRDIVDHQASQVVESLYLFDILGTGLVLALFFVSAILWITDTSPLAPITTAIFICSLGSCLGYVRLVGTYQQTAALPPVVAMIALSVGFVVFAYANDMKRVLFFGRVSLILTLMVVIIISSFYARLSKPTFTKHPIDDTVYGNRVHADRWLRYAAVSDTLRLAVSEYKERHDAREPPPNFDKWFAFAQERNSVIVDNFEQIKADVLPFWRVKPQKIRDGLDILKNRPGIGIITILNGEVSHNQPSDSIHRAALDDTVSMISKFAQHLAPMSIAVNLEERPKVLVPWEALSKGVIGTSKLNFSPGRVQKRQESGPISPQGSLDGDPAAPVTSTTRQYVSAPIFRHLQALACPPGSAARAGIHWDARDFCVACVTPHSKDLILTDFERSLDPCHQPDIFNLHDFYTIPHRFELYQDLLPLFSRSKTKGFNDILIPLSRPDVIEEPDPKSFNTKFDTVYWQGDLKDSQPLTHQSLHGGHRHRLVHLANNASATDKVTMTLGKEDSGKQITFHYEDVHTKAASDLLPLSFSFTNPSGCVDTNCRLIEQEFGIQPQATAQTARYIMLLDSPDGPSPQLLPALRSTSAPVLSTVFREWFTDRLFPWVHFIPIDVRYHSLHNTLTYFLGLMYRGHLNGRQHVTEGRKNDARWIADQSRKWANKAIRREDMEIYLFRLLLEWGRVIDDQRDDLKYVLKEGL